METKRGWTCSCSSGEYGWASHHGKQTDHVVLDGNSFVGLFNTLFLLPLVPILSVLGVETFELPIRRSDWIVCAINMGITLSSDYLYVLAMLKTTPLGKHDSSGKKQSVH